MQGYERSTSEIKLQNSVGHYGGSLGLLYHLNSVVSFDARVSYSTGGAIKFINLNSPQRTAPGSNTVDFKTISSPASDVLIFRLGVVLRLKKCETCATTRTRDRSINIMPQTPAPRPAQLKPMPAPTPAPAPINH